MTPNYYLIPLFGTPTKEQLEKELYRAFRRTDLLADRPTFEFYVPIKSPTPIREIQDYIFQHIDSEGILRVTESQYEAAISFFQEASSLKPGQAVLVIQGKYKNIQGFIESIDGTTVRLRVTLANRFRVIEIFTTALQEISS